MESLLSIRHVHRASRLLDEQHCPREQAFVLPALRGGLSELSARCGHPHLTLAFQWIADAHRSGEPAAWIGGPTSIFYPPDADRWNLDWSALAVVRLDSAHQRLRAADKLLRCGGFGLVVVDVDDSDTDRLPHPLMGRLLRLAETHDSAVVFLTNTSEGACSIGPLVSMRAHLRWADADPRRLRIECDVIKDKRRGPGHRWSEEYDGPMGLR